MKKYFLLNLFAILILLLMLFSCKTTQPINEVKETTIVNHDSINLVKFTIRNQAIVDSLKIIIGSIKTEKKECDSVCQIAIDKLLSQLNTSKKSGANSYNVNYNSKDKSLNFNSKIGATENKIYKVYYRITKTVTLYKTKEIPVDKPLPKWQIILMQIGAVTIGYLLLKFITFIKPKV
ncbi:hypothetical protein [Flavobacterium commune]|nr:hypothetical protein [Flavobacterium commune]